LFNSKFITLEKYKIFVVSVTKVNEEKIMIKYLLDNIIKNEFYNGLFEFSYISKNEDYIKKINIGKWQKVKLNNDRHIVHLFN